LKARVVAVERAAKGETLDPNVGLVLSLSEAEREEIKRRLLQGEILAVVPAKGS
jgi:hypothetical protein